MNNQKKLKILFLSDWYPHPDNPIEGIFVKEYARAVLQNNEIVVIYPREKKNRFSDSVEEGIRTIRIPFKKIALPGLSLILQLIKIKRVINKLIKEGWRPDLIHAHLTNSALVASILGKCYKIPIVVTEHFSGFTRQRLNFFGRLKAALAMNRAQIILPVSNYLKEALVKHGVKTPMRVIPNVVNTDIFYPSFDQKIEDPKQILSVTALKEVKGISFLLKALALLKEKRQDFVLELVGYGPREKEYRKLTQELEISNFVSFRGRKTKNEVADLMRRCSFFIHPSLDETFGVSLIEAMACGKPVIATKIPVFEEKINKERGLLVPRKNPNSLAQAMDYMLDHFKEYSPAKITQYIKNNFSYEVISKKIDRVYQETLNLNQEKRALFITYSFPPTGGGGIQRTTKFIKYLPQSGWLTDVLTTQGNINTLRDENLLKEIPESTRIYRTTFFNPLALNIGLSRQKICLSRQKIRRCLARLIQGLIFAINDFLFIPDNAMLWLLPAYWRAKKIIKENQIDLLYSTSGANTAHLIAYLLKKKTKIPWVADFRDPWTQNPSRKYRTGLHRRINEWLEKKILKSADRIITVSEPITKNFIAQVDQENGHKFITITNGFDHSDFAERVIKSNNKMTIVYAGSFYGQRTPEYFLKAAENLIKNKKIPASEIEIRLISHLDEHLKRLEVLRSPILADSLKVIDYLPHHECIKEIMGADLLLLIIIKAKGSEGTMTGKIFEYLATGHPIIALAPKNSAASQLIGKTKGGVVVEPEDIEKIEPVLYNQYLRWKNKKRDFEPNWEEINKYERKRLTQKLAAIFNELTP